VTVRINFETTSMDQITQIKPVLLKIFKVAEFKKKYETASVGWRCVLKIWN